MSCKEYGLKVIKREQKVIAALDSCLARKNQGTFFVVGTGEMHGGVDVWWAQSMLFLNQKFRRISSGLIQYET